MNESKEEEFDEDKAYDPIKDLNRRLKFLTRMVLVFGFWNLIGVVIIVNLLML